MFKNFFRQKRLNKENEDEEQRYNYQQQQQQEEERQHRRSNEFDRSMTFYKSLRNGREKRPSHSTHHHYQGSVSGGLTDEGFSASAPYHMATQRKYPRGTQSCYDAISDEYDQFCNTHKSSSVGVNFKHKPSRHEYKNSIRRGRIISEYVNCNTSPNTPIMYSGNLDDSDADTWNSERIIKELRAELRATNERKNYYKELYRRERQDRIRDRELRDLVEKKLMDDLKSKELECSNNLLRINALEQQLEHQSNFPPPMRESSFRIPHFCTPSTSNTASTMAGAGEALSSTSELFGVRGAYLANSAVIGTETAAAAAATTTSVDPRNPGEMLDETKIFRQPDEYSLEIARNNSGADASHNEIRNNEATQASISALDLELNHEKLNDTILEDDPQSDNGYGTTSECASELVRSIRRVHSDTELSLKVIQT